MVTLRPNGWLDSFQKQTGWALLLACLCWGLFSVTANSEFAADQVRQVSAAKNFLKGNGLVIYYADPQSEAGHSIEPLFRFPPLYSLIFAGGYWVSGNLQQTADAIDICSAGLFYAAWYLLLNLLCREEVLTRFQVNFIWLIWLLIWSPIATLSFTDLLAVAFFSLSLYFQIRLINPTRPLWIGMAGGFCLGLACASRFAYLPLISAPVLIFLLQRILRNGTPGPSLLGHVGTVGGAGAVAWATAWFQSSTTGAATFLGNYYPELTWSYWSWLTRFDPFPASSIGLVYSLRLFSEKFTVLKPLALILAWSISVAVVGLIGMTVRRRVVTWSNLLRSFCVTPTSAVFWSYGLITATIVCAMLSYLTIRTPPQFFWTSYGWTFVQESRYFCPTFPFISIALIGSLTTLPYQSLFQRRALWYPALVATIVVLGTICLSRAWEGGTYLADYKSRRTQRANVMRDLVYTDHALARMAQTAPYPGFFLVEKDDGFSTKILVTNLVSVRPGIHDQLLRSKGNSNQPTRLFWVGEMAAGDHQALRRVLGPSPPPAIITRLTNQRALYAITIK